MSEYISALLQQKVVEISYDHCEYCLCPADYSINGAKIDCDSLGKLPLVEPQ